MFEPGDEVECIDSSGPYAQQYLEKGEIYTVENCDGNNLKLKNIDYTTKSWRFQLRRRNQPGPLLWKSKIEKETTGKALALAVKNLVDSGVDNIKIKVDNYVVTIKKQ